MTDPAGFNPDQDLSLAGLRYRSFDNPKVTGRYDFDCFVCLCHPVLSNECLSPVRPGGEARCSPPVPLQPVAGDAYRGRAADDDPSGASRGPSTSLAASPGPPSSLCTASSGIATRMRTPAFGGERMSSSPW